MATRYYTCGIVGSGADDGETDDSHRPEIEDDGVSFAAEIPTDRDGRPINVTCVVMVDERDDATVTKRSTVERATDLTAARATIEASRGDIRLRSEGTRLNSSH